MYTKKIHIALCLALLLPCACQKKESYAAIDIPTDSIVVDTLQRLTAEENAPTMHLHLSLVLAKDQQYCEMNRYAVIGALDNLTEDYPFAADEAEQILRERVAEQLKDYVSAYRPLYLDDREHPESYTIDLDVRTQILTTDSPDSIVYCHERTFQHGAAPTTQHTERRFALQK